MECVKVVVRCRPRNKKELDEKRESIVAVNTKIGQIVLGNGKQTPGAGDYKQKSFTFDAVYDEKSTQRSVYDETAFPLVEKVLEGFNATIFAYGQTGCGKTWTMSGREDNQAEMLNASHEKNCFRGIIPNSFHQIFESIRLKMAEETSGNVSFLVRASYLEIYNEEVRDLLSVKSSNEKSFKALEVKEGDQGVYVKDLTCSVAETEADLENILHKGDANRSVGATAMNAASSRSHSIFTIIIEISESSESAPESDEKAIQYKVGKLNLVDLAGSERQGKTGAAGDRLKEGCKINLSLSALGNVISALVDSAKGRSKFVPYRDSKLTRLLQDSLGGNTKTVMIANISPADYNYEETLSTLRYADRAKRIKNQPIINEDPKDALLREYQKQIEQLKSELKSQSTSFPIAPAAEVDEHEPEIRAKVEELGEALEIQNKIIEEHAKEKGDLKTQLVRLQSKIIQLKGDNEMPNSSRKKADEKDENEKSLEELRNERKRRETYIKQIEREKIGELSRIQHEENEKENKEMENELTNAKDEMEAKQKAIKALKRRLRKTTEKFKQEINDLEAEHLQDKAELFDSIRQQNREIQRLEQILDDLLPNDVLQKLWDFSEWDEDQGRWNLASFQKPLCHRCRNSTSADSLQSVSLPQLQISHSKVNPNLNINLNEEVSDPLKPSDAEEDHFSLSELKRDLAAATPASLSHSFPERRVKKNVPRTLAPLS